MRIMIAAIGVGLMLCAGGQARVADAAELSAAEIARSSGFSDEDTARVVKGEVVSRDIAETTEKMLGGAVALLIPVDVATISGRVLAENFFGSDPELESAGRIDPKAPEKGLADLVFTPAEAEEAEAFLDAEPGSEFNLSSEEYAKIAAARAAGAKGPEAASKLYQEILATRVKAYAAQGLAGIVPYDRGDETASAAGDLRAMTEASTGLAKALPDLYKAFLEYPKGVPAGVKERFSWEKRTVEDRPTFILVHRMALERPDVLAVLRREFYVGHSYNAAQGVSGAFPTDKGTLVLSGQRSTTDQVAGFMSGTRHAIGRDMLQDEVVENFERLRTEVAK